MNEILAELLGGINHFGGAANPQIGRSFLKLK